MHSTYIRLSKYFALYGFNVYSARQLSQKIENTAPNFQPTANHLVVLDWFKGRLKVNNQSYQIRLVINIFLLHLLTTYRGWRHSRGLPVRGQRTWSNGWSSYRSNLTLRSFKIKIAKHLYGGQTSNEYVTAYLAEEVNNMWRLQWGS